MLLIILAFVVGGAAEAVISAIVHHVAAKHRPPQTISLDESTTQAITHSHEHRFRELVREEIRRYHPGGGGHVH